MEKQEFFVFAEATELLKQRELYEIKEALDELKNIPSAKNRKFIRTNLLEDYVIRTKISILKDNKEEIIENLDSLKFFYKTSFPMEYNLIYIKKNNFLDYVNFRNHLADSHSILEA